MVSFKAQFIHWYIYFWQYLANRASIKQIQDNVQKTFKTENQPVVLPASIPSNTGISVTKEIFESDQEWEVFHVKPRGGEGRKKVVIYWHGGAFIRGVSFFLLGHGHC
jgi:acetyl esterase/lipase